MPASPPPPVSPANQELGAFLRAHREALKPSQVGLSSTARRRTPGLRREEVASMSGVGLAWYTWLEQGRVAASRQVLESLARALRLDPAAVRHAMRLAGFHDPAGPVEQDGHGTLGPTVQPVLDSWPLSPAALVDRHFDLLAWNTAWQALLGAPGAVPAVRRNLMWLLVASGRPRNVLGADWEPLAMNVFQHFRAQAGRALSDARTAEVHRLLGEDTPQLAHWWGCRSVADLTARTVTARPEGTGPIRLSLTSFHPVDDASALVVLFTPCDAADRSRMTDLLAAAPRTTPAPGDGLSERVQGA